MRGGTVPWLGTVQWMWGGIVPWLGTGLYHVGLGLPLGRVQDETKKYGQGYTVGLGLFKKEVGHH